MSLNMPHLSPPHLSLAGRERTFDLRQVAIDRRRGQTFLGKFLREPDHIVPADAGRIVVPDKRAEFRHAEPSLIDPTRIGSTFVVSPRDEGRICQLLPRPPATSAERRPAGMEGEAATLPGKAACA